jgi:hypothetical protein
VAIATGSYDGGWCFEGELALWKWETGQHGLAFQQTPEVVRVAFSPGGDTIIAYVRPWHEGIVEEQIGGADPFDLFYEVRATFFPNLTSGLWNTDAARQMEQQSPVPGASVAEDSRLCSVASDATSEVRRHIGVNDLRTRSSVWDLAWLPGDHLGIVHGDCHLQSLMPNGAIAASYTGEGHGCEIHGGASPIVHVTRGDWRTEFSSTLFRLTDAGLNEEISFAGAHTFSRAVDGRMLGGRDRVIAREFGVKDRHLTGGVWQKVDLGDYDVVHHYLRVDDAPFLFLVQNDVPGRGVTDLITSRPQRKWLCILEPDGSVIRLWQLLRDEGTNASHPMECTFAYISDDAGESMVVAGKHFGSRPNKGFMYRGLFRGGKELWRVPTSASATIIRHVPSAGVILAFFLSGEEFVLSAATGSVLRQRRFEPDGLPSVVFSCAVGADRVAVGAVDGRIGVSPLSEFLVTGKRPPPRHREIRLRYSVS